MSRWYRWTAIAAVVAVIVVALHTCGIGSRIAEREPVEDVEAALTLQTVTLEQPDENGKLLWRLKAKSVTYSPDNQRAELKGLDGEFYQEGETVYTVVADEGEVQQNGETLYLRGNLVATSKANELTLEGERLKWQPKADRLVMGDFKDEAWSERDFSKPGDAKTDDAKTDDAKTDDAKTDETAESQTEDLEDSRAEDSQATQALLASDAPPLMVASFLTEEDQKPPVKGSSPQLEAIARVVTVTNKENRVELAGGVAAKSSESPWMTFESERLLWFPEREQIEAEKPLTVKQYEEKAAQTASDFPAPGLLHRIVGETGSVNLATNMVTLDKSVQLDSIDQTLKVQSETAVWDVEGQVVALDKPVNIEQPAQKITASANQASLDLAEEVIYLTGNVRANGEQNDAQLLADRVTWKTGSQDIEAEGNVSYRQAADPEISMTGTQAVGNLENGTVVVTGGVTGSETTEGDVVIEFTAPQ